MFKKTTATWIFSVTQHSMFCTATDRWTIVAMADHLVAAVAAQTALPPDHVPAHCVGALV
jgi:hypothetical protein